jgi:hypothetical protein
MAWKLLIRAIFHKLINVRPLAVGKANKTIEKTVENL